MQLNSVIRLERASPDSTNSLKCWLIADIGEGPEELVFIYVEGDPHGLSPQVEQFLIDNPEFPIDDYVEPPEPDPIDPNTINLPRREFRRALLHNGMDTAAVMAVIGAITDPVEREEMTIWWEDTQHFERFHPVLVQMVAAAGLTIEQADDIWAYGVGLVDGE